MRPPWGRDHVDSSSPRARPSACLGRGSSRGCHPCPYVGRSRVLEMTESGIRDDFATLLGAWPARSSRTSTLIGWTSSSSRCSSRSTTGAPRGSRTRHTAAYGRASRRTGIPTPRRPLACASRCSEPLRWCWTTRISGDCGTCAYADDFLLGFIGPREEAEAIKRRIGEFLHDQLGLELSETKTLITHARTEHARFLGYDIGTLQQDERRGRHGRFNGKVALKVPAEAVRERCKSYSRRGRPIHRQELVHDSEFSIVAQFQQEVSGLRGILQAGDEPELPPRSPEVGHGDGLDQDAGAEARHQRIPGLRPIRDHAPDGPGPSQGARSQGGTRREAAARGEMGWHHARSATIRSPRRSGATRRCRTLGAARAAAGRRLRALRLAGSGPGPSCPAPEGLAPEAQGPGPTPEVGPGDGITPSQDPCRLPRVPHGNPSRRPARARTPDTGHWRAGCGQSRTSGSEGGRRKRADLIGTSPAAYPTCSPGRPPASPAPSPRPSAGRSGSPGHNGRWPGTRSPTPGSSGRW